MITILLLAAALLADILTTRLAVSAGAVETNTLYGKHPNMRLLDWTHAGALVVAYLLLRRHPDVAPMLWGASGVMGAVSVWNMIVWRKQTKGDA